MKNKIIWIIIGIVILIMFLQPSEKEYKKMAGTPLLLTDLENIELTQVNENLRLIQILIKEGAGYGEWKGDWDSGYIDGDETEYGQISIRSFGNEAGQLFDEGDYITLYFDGTSLKIYLPSKSVASQFDLSQLYPANDGSTYYDVSLTQDACTIANGCMETEVYDYQYFLDEKNAYLNGGDFNTFITNTNNWL